MNTKNLAIIISIISLLGSAAAYMMSIHKQLATQTIRFYYLEEKVKEIDALRSELDLLENSVIEIEAKLGGLEK